MKLRFIKLIVLMSLISCVQEKTELVFSDPATGKSSFGDRSPAANDNPVVITKEPVLMQKQVLASYYYNLFAKQPEPEFNSGTPGRSSRFVNLLRSAATTAWGPTYAESGCDGYSAQLAGWSEGLDGAYANADNGQTIYAFDKDSFHLIRDIGEDCMTEKNNVRLSNNYNKAKDDVFTRQIKIVKCENLVGGYELGGMPIGLSFFFYHHHYPENTVSNFSFVPEFNEENIVKAIRAFYPVTLSDDEVIEASQVWLKLKYYDEYSDLEKWKFTVTGICQSLFWELQ